MYSPNKSSSRRFGVVIPMVMLVLMSLLVFTAMAVDLGHVYVVHGQMQHAVDATALAGATGLKEGEPRASWLANDFAGRNDVDGQMLSSHELTVIVGNWEGTARAFFPLTGLETVAPNAVRITGRYPNLPLVFAPVIGINFSNVSKQATASGGSGQCAGIWGLEEISGNGNLVTDSYDSRIGPYGDENIFSNGDICSCQNIGLVGDVEIHGDAMYGQGFAFDTSGGALEVWGTAAPMSCGIVPPVIDMDEAMVTNDNDLIGLTDDGRNPFVGGSEDLRLTGTDNLTLDPGTYYFTSIRLLGLSTLTVDGPTIIYVSGTADLTGGGVINLTGDPANLIIYATGTDMHIRGGSGFYGTVVAPDTDISISGTPDFYGAIMGRTVDLSGNTNIHIDEAIVSDIFGLDSVTVALVE